jgi:serine/threonine protein kinase
MSAQLHPSQRADHLISRDAVRLLYDEDDPTQTLESDDPTQNLDSEVNIDAAPAASSLHTQTSGESSRTAPASAPQPLVVGPGTKLRERYLLQHVIGSGGTSMVYRAQDLRHEANESSTRVIAVKLLREELREDSHSIERLKREFTQMQLLAHPGVLKVFDVDVDHGVWFMTMEMLEGQSLSMYLRTHRSPHPQAFEIIKSCAEALMFAHERGIVHGDLKPGNIFLTSGGVRVLDFIGAADDLRTDRAATPAYASLQRLSGELPDISDDVYSLGCVAYEVLTGVHPFDRKPASVAHELGLQPARINSLSYRQWRALDRALAFDRLDRHRTLRLFLDALFHEQGKPEAVPVADMPASATLAQEQPGATNEAPPAASVIPIAMPAAVLSMPPEEPVSSATAVNAPAQLDVPPPTPLVWSPPEPARPYTELRLRDQETLLEPLDGVREARPGDPLPPLFEPPRASVTLPVIIGLVLAVLALYLARSDIQPDVEERIATPAAASTLAAPVPEASKTLAAPGTAAPAPAPIEPAPQGESQARSVALESPSTKLAPPLKVKDVAATPAVRAPVATASRTTASKVSARGAGATAATAAKANASAVGFQTSRVSVSERSVAAVIQVKRLGNATAGRLPIHWRTEARSAKPGDDYGAVASGTMVLQDGQRIGAIYVPITNDDVEESDEMFVVELLDTSQARSPEIGLAIVTIRDDDRVLLTSTP